MGKDELAKVGGEAAHRYVCKLLVTSKLTVGSLPKMMGWLVTSLSKLVAKPLVETLVKS
jgi:hypothetical protein